MPVPSESPPPRTALDLAAVAAGGALGTGLRTALVAALPPGPIGFPWATVLGNLLGAFLLGMLTVQLQRRGTDSTRLHLFLGTGTLGAFTTFSALAVDVLVLIEAQVGEAVGAYLLLSLPGGVAAALLGLAAGRALPLDPPDPGAGR